MNKRFLAFDLETAKVLPETVTDLFAHRPVGIACAAAVAADRRNPFVWHGGASRERPSPRLSKSEASQLIQDLANMVADGYTILTWNGLGFDFDVLQEESGLRRQCATLALGHVDMMFHLLCLLGHFVALDRAAQGMRISGKFRGMKGSAAPVLWAQGRSREVLDYNVQDALVLLELATACEYRGALEWVTRRGGTRLGPLPEGWLKVCDARALPEPDTSWMSDPPRRENSYRWLP